MASHRYWRAINFVIPGGGDMEIAELRLCHNGAYVDTGLTFTASVAPALAITSLNDGNLSTRTYWTEAQAEDPSFWIKWDFGTATEVTQTRFAGYDNGTRYPSAYTVQWSDDDSAWTDFIVLTGLTYPGNNTYSTFLPLPPPGPVFELDAEDYTSGQTWANQIGTPADGSLPAAYDYYLGGAVAVNTDDPTYVAGPPSYFSFDGGDLFTLALGTGGPAFLKTLHHANKKFTIEMWMQWSGSLNGNITPMFDSGSSDQSGSDMSRGVLFLDLGSARNSGSKIAFRVKTDSGAGDAFVKLSDAVLPSNSVRMVALSYDGTGASNSFFYHNGNYEPAAGADTWPVVGSFGTSNATNPPRIGARGDASAKVNAGARLYFLRVYNTNLSKAELDVRWGALGPRYGYASYTLVGTVVDSANVPLEDHTVRIYRRDTGALLAEVVSGVGGAWTTILNYGGEVQVIALDATADPLQNDVITRVIPIQD